MLAEELAVELEYKFDINPLNISSTKNLENLENLENLDIAASYNKVVHIDSGVYPTPTAGFFDFLFLSINCLLILR